MARHLSKCRRGDTCPWCGCLSADEKTQFLKRMHQSPEMDHYVNCRTIPGIFDCHCPRVKKAMKEMKDLYFPDQPLSLHLLEVCAVTGNSGSLDITVASLGRGGDANEMVCHCYSTSMEILLGSTAFACRGETRCGSIFGCSLIIHWHR
jgi:hypothetical protein